MRSKSLARARRLQAAEETSVGSGSGRARLHKAKETCREIIGESLSSQTAEGLLVRGYGKGMPPQGGEEACREIIGRARVRRLPKITLHACSAAHRRKNQIGSWPLGNALAFVARR